MTPLPVFDGHNDLLLRLFLAAPGDRDRLWLEGDGKGHLDLPRMRRAGFAGGLFAIFAPPPRKGPDLDALVAQMDAPPYDLPLPPEIRTAAAAPAALAQAGLLLRMERLAPDHFTLCRDAAAIRAAMAAGRIAAVMHMEGAEAIGTDLDALHAFHALGLRSLGPVWSRPNAFGHGVPFRFPGDPDAGPGLTDAGRALVRACDALGILVDLSHLTAAGVDDVAAVSARPLVATHSNAHAVCPSPRNLTDRQLSLIAERDGLVGLNFGTIFLRPDGRRDTATGWDPLLRHLDHLIDRLGEDRVGFGSDFDGVPLPDVMGDVTGLPALQAALRAHGIDEPLLEKLCSGNWLRLLERSWGA